MFLYFRCIPFASLFPFFFFFNDTATTEIYTLSLHDALPIFGEEHRHVAMDAPFALRPAFAEDRKSTRLNSSHTVISYAVFCLKKKTNRYADDETHGLASVKIGNVLLGRSRTRCGKDDSKA